MTVRLYAIILLLVAVVVLFSGCASSQNTNTLSHNVGVQASVVRMGLDELAQMTYADNVRDFENQNPAKPTLLVVEDNAGMMTAIVETLHD